MVNLLYVAWRKLHNDFHSDFTSLTSRQQLISVSLSANPLPHLPSHNFKGIGNNHPECGTETQKKTNVTCFPSYVDGSFYDLDICVNLEYP